MASPSSRDAGQCTEVAGRVVNPSHCNGHCGRTTGNLEMNIESDMPESVNANPGEKMIVVEVRFWTDELSGNPEQVVPKHGHTSGVVKVRSNDTHGIKPTNPLPFDSLLQIAGAVEQALIDNGIVLHQSRAMAKYIAPHPEGIARSTDIKGERL